VQTKNKVVATLVLIALCSCVVVGVYAAAQYQALITGTGKIVSVSIGIYSDQACTTPLSTIDWGTLSPGQTKTVTCYIKSTSTIDSTLSMATGSWSPSSASSYITCSWNHAGYKISSGEVVSATVTLTVSQSITGISAFSFTITVTATEA
jgi:hypothetical protein